jgi:hypothetical protein
MVVSRTANIRQATASIREVLAHAENTPVTGRCMHMKRGLDCSNYSSLLILKLQITCAQADVPLNLLVS